MNRQSVQMIRRLVIAAGCAVLAASCIGAPAVAAAGSESGAARPRFGHVDVLFIGAHPDDESGNLATFGQWNEYHHISVGELTLTRGEGGGDAVGDLSGPPLALFREAEQRRALAYAGMRNVYYLDKPDFYYTTSETTVGEDWNWRSTLANVVRVVRETEPKVIVTMEPGPFPGQHGAHQFSARAALAAYELAANPRAFPGQITGELLRPWAVSPIFTQAFPGTTPPGIGTAATGPGCAASLKPLDPFDGQLRCVGRDQVGEVPHHLGPGRGRRRPSVRQPGFRGYPARAEEPREDRLRVVHAGDQPGSGEPRRPFRHRAVGRCGTARPQRAAARHPVLAVLESLHDRARGPFHGNRSCRRPRGRQPARRQGTAAGAAGWSVSHGVGLGTVRPGQARTARFTVTVSGTARPGTRLKLAATLRSRRGIGGSDTPQAVVAPVSATPPELTELSAFDAWARQYGYPQLEHTVFPVVPIGRGKGRPFPVTIRNNSVGTASGAVSVRVPSGFRVSPSRLRYRGLRGGQSKSVTFTLANTNTKLPTGDLGPNGGNYPFRIKTTSSSGRADVEQGAINLAPSTTIPEATVRPAVDGKQSAPGEYPGPTLNVSRVWQGPACPTSSVCSATAKLSWYGNSLYALVSVKANSPGTILAPSNCQQVWRTDAVTLEIDPKGTYAGDNPSTDLQFQILPETRDPAHGDPPCDQSDADFHQTNTYGQISTAKLMPGLKLASIVSKPFTGYSTEVRIPFADLPSAVNPSDMGLNFINYYSNNDHLIGTTRLAWSAWNSVQSDPYHWGVATLAGYRPPNPGLKRPVAFPNTPLAGIHSPQSILQAARTNVPLSGAPLAAPGDRGQITGQPAWSAGKVRVRLRATGAGLFNVYVWDPVTGRKTPQAGELGHGVLRVHRGGTFTVEVPVANRPPSRAELAVAFANPRGANDSSAARSIGGSG